MSVQKVRDYFAARGFTGEILEFEQSSATVELAAQAVGVIPARIAKTLSFRQGDGCVLIVAAGDARVDNKKFKAQFSMKATMLTPEEVLALTGHAVGGVCPFAIEDERVTTYLDQSLRRFETVYPAAGSASSAVNLTCDELEHYSNAAEWIDVCKDWAESI